MACRRMFLGGIAASGLVAGLGRHAFGQTADIPFRMVYFGDFAPFSLRLPDGSVQGHFVDVVNDLLVKRLGWKLEHQAYPWARAQAMVRGGEADGFCTVPTAERRDYVLASATPLARAPVRMFVHPGNPLLPALSAVRRLDELKPFRLGLYIGSGWADANLRALGLDIQEAPDLAGALRLVANGRVDAVVDNAETIRLRMAHPDLQGRLLELPTVLDMQAYHLCIGRTSPFAGRMAAVDAAMAGIGPGGGPVAAAKAI